MITHSFPFDPTCSYSKEELLQISLPDYEPEDFQDFWKSTFESAMKIPLKITKRPIWSEFLELEIFEIFYDSLEEIRIGAWLIRPKNSKGGIVEGHGYGGRHIPDLTWAKKGFTSIQLCVRGFNLSMNAQIPWHSSAHVIHKIESRDQYVLRGATVDTWLAASVLLELFPDTTENLNYTGCSFGGGMGALALPWDHRFKHAYLDIPTFGHHHLRLKYESLGSGESVRKFYDTHPDIIETLRYYDAALSAKYIKIPVVCTPALFDPVVVPPGQFAIANALNSQSETIILPTGHFDSPESTEIKEKLDPRLEKMFEA